MDTDFHEEQQCRNMDCEQSNPQPLSAFPKYGYQSDGSQECKKCGNKRSRAYRIRSKYGLSVEKYEAKLAQGCSICGTTEGRIVFDHDHASGGNRDALCCPCNRALGLFQDNPQVLRSAAEYVEKHAE